VTLGFRLKQSGQRGNLGRKPNCSPARARQVALKEVLKNLPYLMLSMSGVFLLGVLVLSKLGLLVQLVLAVLVAAGLHVILFLCSLRNVVHGELFQRNGVDCLRPSIVAVHVKEAGAAANPAVEDELLPLSKIAPALGTPFQQERLQLLYGQQASNATNFLGANLLRNLLCSPLVEALHDPVLEGRCSATSASCSLLAQLART
jgi:hypothetical protein